MPVIKYMDVTPVERAPGCMMRQFVNQDMGAGAVTLGELIMQPGSALPIHTHKIEEAMFLVEGQLVLLDGDKSITVDAGTAILAPAWVKHNLANKTDKPARLLFCYPGVNVQRDVVNP